MIAIHQQFIDFVRSEEMYNSEKIIPLHAPVFLGNEKKYLCECIDTTYVSSVGTFVSRFEQMVEEFTGAKRSIAVSNGTAALHASLHVLGVRAGEEVITQALTFVATANAISYTGARPIFLDVDIDTMGLSPKAVNIFLKENAELREGVCVNLKTGKKISACIPMHTFGFPMKIKELVAVCDKWNIPVIEDAAGSLGSRVDGAHTGLFGKLGAFSFNGNKSITTGGGGMIITNEEALGARVMHVTTTAKISHKWEFVHDEIGFNYRLPNINAALGCAQMEKFDDILKNKRQTAQKYKIFFDKFDDYQFVTERENTEANYWLNTIILKDLNSKKTFLQDLNKGGIMARPVWKLMNKLEMFKQCQTDGLKNSLWLEERILNIPSGVRS